MTGQHRMPASIRRPPSPLAHDTDGWCDTCHDCPSCDGGTRPVPRQYRPVARPDGRLVAHCTRCDGTGTSCLNVVRNPSPLPTALTPILNSLQEFLR